MELHVGKWGNSLALRLPATVVKKMHLCEGAKVELALQVDGSATLTAPKVFDLPGYMAEVRAITQNMPMTPSVIEEMRDDARY
jgi:antitoxin MazE